MTDGLSVFVAGVILAVAVAAAVFLGAFETSSKAKHMVTTTSGFGSVYANSHSIYRTKSTGDIPIGTPVAGVATSHRHPSWATPIAVLVGVLGLGAAAAVVIRSR